MKRAFRLAAYLLAMALLLGSLVAGPQAWATPEQIENHQTVPTRTPKPPPPTTAPPPAPRPTSEPQPTAPPQPTATPVGTATPAPMATAPATPAGLSLSLSGAPVQVWSGVTVVYTLTVTNLATVALRDVVALDPLPAELEPGAILAGHNADWQSGTLRVAFAELAAGAQAEVVFTAKVAAAAPAGKVIVNRATATTGAATVGASAAVAMPPAELPAVGSNTADRH